MDNSKNWKEKNIILNKNSIRSIKLRKNTPSKRLQKRITEVNIHKNKKNKINKKRNI